MLSLLTLISVNTDHRLPDILLHITIRSAVFDQTPVSNEGQYITRQAINSINQCVVGHVSYGVDRSTFA